MQVIVTSRAGDDSYSGDAYTVEYYLKGTNSQGSAVTLPLNKNRKYVSNKQRTVMDPVCFAIDNSVPRGEFFLLAKLRMDSDSTVVSETTTEHFYIRNLPFQVKSVAITNPALRVAAPNQRVTIEAEIERKTNTISESLTNTIAAVSFYIKGMDGASRDYLGGKTKWIGENTYTWGVHDNVYPLTYALPANMPAGKYKFIVYVDSISSTAGVGRAQHLSEFGASRILNVVSAVPSVGITDLPVTVPRGESISPTPRVVVTKAVGSRVYVDIKNVESGKIVSQVSFACNSDPCELRPTLGVPADEPLGRYKFRVRVKSSSNLWLANNVKLIEVTGPSVDIRLNLKDTVLDPLNKPPYVEVDIGEVIPGTVVVTGECSRWDVFAKLTVKGPSEDDILSSETLVCNAGPTVGYCNLAFRSLRVPAGNDERNYQIWISVKDSNGNLLERQRFFFKGVSTSTTPTLNAKVDNIVVPASVVRGGPITPLPSVVVSGARGTRVFMDVVLAGKGNVVSNVVQGSCNSDPCTFRPALSTPATTSPGTYKLRVVVKNSAGEKLVSGGKTFSLIADPSATPTLNPRITNIVVPASVARGAPITPLPSVVVSGASGTRVFMDVVVAGKSKVVSNVVQGSCNSDPCTFRPSITVPATKVPGRYKLRVIVKNSAGEKLVTGGETFNLIDDPVKATGISALAVGQVSNNQKLRIKAVVGYKYPHQPNSPGIQVTISQNDGSYKKNLNFYDPSVRPNPPKGYKAGTYTSYRYNFVDNGVTSSEKVYVYKKKAGQGNQDYAYKYIFKWPIPDDLPRGHDYTITTVMTANDYLLDIPVKVATVRIA